MGIEIERKFLVKNEAWKRSIQDQFIIKQGYLSVVPERTVRVRIKKDKGVLTIKGKTVGATRAEFEYEIPLADATYMIDICEKPLIEKRRYIIVEHGHRWELDVFEGANKGLILAEIELDQEDEEITLPEWIGKEVTSETRYYNSNLGKHPYSLWGRE